ncbi:MAG: O-antigen ligase family protein [Deltaproteobacteria bacterium]|nr:O-antigen ligase family protein [Deltaproteobacteria bacterium]
MAKKTKAKAEAKTTEGSQPDAAASAEEAALEPMTGGVLDTLLVAGAAAVVILVAWRFELDVNRVFDVPKALALKVGGAGIFLVWLLYGMFGGGYPWRSIRLFAAPLGALALVFGLSTLTSIDFWMSLYGVYERQFGFQGVISCVGLFVVTATCLRSKRGAVAALAVLAVVGGVIGAYGYLQATGNDPYGFFKAPNNKVYSTLGNATFAGNALALIFPVSFLLSVVTSVHAIRGPAESPGARLGRLPLWIGSVVLFGALLVLPGIFSKSSGTTSPESQFYFKAGTGVAVLLLAAFAGMGSFGPAWTRAEAAGSRRTFDVLAAGGLAAYVLAIFVGLFVTRTRGAWVGTAVAVVGGLALLPRLFDDEPAQYLKAKILCWGGLASAFAVVVALIVLNPDHVYSQTIRSIPHAFNPEQTVYGQGQGTRRYLWTESPRVLVDHHKTLARMARDRAEKAEKLAAHPPVERPAVGALRQVLVWPLGIGIEAYRYAFMSHKSKKLEALDPMTNHDNPHNNYLYILASCGILGLAAYLWLLWRLLATAWGQFSRREGRSRADRALAFGVVTSFFSYAVYSIAGFDSVACSVFLYYLLGVASVLFAPAGDEPRRPIGAQIRRHWAEYRGRPVALAEPSVPAALIATILVGGVLVQTIYGGYQVFRAERVFVGERGARPTLESRIESVKKAIEINPRESFYWQTLGSTYGDASRQYRDAAARAQQGGQADQAKGYLTRARELKQDAERAFYSALDHAWAPENIYISLFQLYYGWQQATEAEHALERALEHSPHLGPVRANLAALKDQRGAYQEALVDCRWVLDIEPGNAVSLRTCGHAAQQLGQLESAKSFLSQAVAQGSRDPLVKTYLDQVEAALAAGSSTGAPTSTPASL